MKNKLAIFLLLVALLAPSVALAADVYSIWDSDTRRLEEDELWAYSADELGFIRNEILARYGFPFKTKKYRDYFESQSWYYRDENFVYGWLTRLEMENVELIKQVEAQKQGIDGELIDDETWGDEGNDYFIADSDMRLLAKSELRRYSLSELGYIRNEILARHGYPFETEKYRTYFESQWWYSRDDGFEYGWLSRLEMDNVELIKQIEREKS